MQLCVHYHKFFVLFTQTSGLYIHLVLGSSQHCVVCICMRQAMFRGLEAWQNVVGSSVHVPGHLGAFWMPLMTKKPVCASCPSWLASGLLHWPQSPCPTSSSEGWEQVASSTRLLFSCPGGSCCRNWIHSVPGAGLVGSIVNSAKRQSMCSFIWLVPKAPPSRGHSSWDTTAGMMTPFPGRWCPNYRPANYRPAGRCYLDGEPGPTTGSDILEMTVWGAP